ncbi:MAG: hypothetical protein KJ052_21145, partial [Candidatus Hydrogenedentes bacterium]|nr:hypothetical protein [Candidatus Hydrogenedentota bacterium]
PWQQAALTTAESLAPLLHQQEAERHAYDTPSATRNILGNGVVVAVHGPVFRAYYQAHYPALRGYIGDMIAALGAELIHADAPPSVEMSARRKEGKLLIQFVNRDASPSLSPSRHMVEHVPASGPFSVTIPCPEKPRRCYLAPDVEGLDWAWSEGTIEARIADLQIHNVLIVE